MTPTTVLCLVFGSLPSLFLLAAALIAVRRSYRLDAGILGATFVHEALLVGWPAVWAALTDFHFEKAMSIPVSGVDLIQVLCGETLFITMILVGYYSARGAHPTATRPERYSLSKNHPLTRLLILAGGVIYGLAFYYPTLGGNPDAEPALSGIFFSLYGWLQSLFWLPALVVCALVVSQPKGIRRGFGWWLLACLPLLFVFFIGVTTGLRGRIIWVISLLVFGAYLQRNIFAIRFAGAALALTLPFFPFFGTNYRAIYQTEAAVGASRMGLLAIVINTGIESVQEGRPIDTIKAIGESLADRGMGSRNSTILYREYESRGGLDLRTWVGSLFFPIPRSLYADKPMPGSPTASPYYAAIYRVMEMGHGFDGYMGPVLSSAVAFHEGGWGWLMISGLATGIFWGVLLRGGIPPAWRAVIALTFAGSLLIDGFFTLVHPTYALLLQAWKVVFMLFLIGCVTLFKRLTPSGARRLKLQK